MDESPLPKDILAGIQSKKPDFGRYIKLEPLGTGGSGEVCKAFDTEKRRFVALKILRPSVRDSSERFRREVEIVAGLQHPYIVPIYDVGVSDGRYYIAMKYVEGDTMEKVARQINIDDAIQIMIKVCEAVHFAHEQGVIHRDIKPHNIIISKDGSPYVLDFGTAKLTDSVLTKSGDTIGTPQYMSPEQVKGEDLDARTDIYSIGLTLYYAVTGEAAVKGGTALTVMHKVVTEEPVAPRLLNRSVSNKLNAIILKCIRKDKQKRYQSLQELTNDLLKFTEQSPKPLKNSRKIKLTAIVIFIIAIASALIYSLLT